MTKFSKWKVPPTGWSSAPHQPFGRTNGAGGLASVHVTPPTGSAWSKAPLGGGSSDVRSACSAIEVAAAGERGTAEVKLAGAARSKALRLLAQRLYAKTPPKSPLESAMNSMPAHQ